MRRDGGGGHRDQRDAGGEGGVCWGLLLADWQVH